MTQICENCGAEVAHEKEHRHKLHWECPEPDWRTRALAAEEQHAHARNENAMLREQLAAVLSERNQAMRERDEANHAYDLVSVLIPGAVETAKERDRLRADNDLLTVERNAEQRKLGTAEEQLAHARTAERLAREALQVAMRERDEARVANALNLQALANERAARTSLTADLAEMKAAFASTAAIVEALAAKDAFSIAELIHGGDMCSLCGESAKLADEIRHKDDCPWLRARRFVGREPAEISSTNNEPNQCDGCRAGKPIDANGNHRMGEGFLDLMRCQRRRYE